MQAAKEQIRCRFPRAACLSANEGISNEQMSTNFAVLAIHASLCYSPKSGQGAGDVIRQLLDQILDGQPGGFNGARYTCERRTLRKIEQD